MVYLICAICCSMLISVIMRLSETRIRNNIAMLAMNYLMCTAVAAFFVRENLTSPPGLTTALLGTVGGFLYLLSFFLLQRNVSINGVMLSATFMKLGVLVSIGVSVVFFGEIPGLLQILGIILAVSAILVINISREKRGSASRWDLIALLLCGGMADAMSKIYEELGSPADTSWFLLGTFLTAFLFCLVLMAVKKQRPGKWELLFGLLIGVPNYFSTLLFMRCLRTVSAVVAFPVYSVGGILAVSVAGMLLFREKLGRRQWIGMGMILLAMILLNL